MAVHLKTSQLFTAVCCLASGMAVANPLPVLNSVASLDAMAPPVDHAGPVAHSLSRWHNGATQDGTGRVQGVHGWGMFASPAAPDGPGMRWLGGVDLATGQVVHRDLQLALPAEASWPLGISYKPWSVGNVPSEAILGTGWFFDAMPVMVEDGDVLHLIYSADAYVSFVKVSAAGQPPVWQGVNGAAGTVRQRSFPQSKTTWRVDFPNGRAAEFLGSEFGAAKGSLWRHGVGDIDIPTNPVAFVGTSTSHRTVPTDLVGSGGGFLSDGRPLVAFDSAGRRFDFVYGTGGTASGSRLVRIDVSVSSEQPATSLMVAQVRYAYSGESGMPSDPAGELSQVRIATWGQGTNPANPTFTTDAPILTKRFRYTSVGGSGGVRRLQAVFGYEGTRRAMQIDGNNAPSADLFTASEAVAADYAELLVRWRNSGALVDGVPVVEAAVFNGLGDVANGTAGETPLSGWWTFKYEGVGIPAGGSIVPQAAPSESTWVRRTTVRRPKADATTVPAVSPGQEYVTTVTPQHAWIVQHFGPWHDPTSVVVADSDPAQSAGPIGAWVTDVQRDAVGRLFRVRSPQNSLSYTFAIAANSPWAVVASEATNVGSVTRYERVSGADLSLEGLVRDVVEERLENPQQAVDGVLLRYQWISHTAGPTPRPWVQAKTEYPRSDTVSASTTTWDTEFWPNSVIPKISKETPPVVPIGQNGSDSPHPSWTLFDSLGRVIGEFSAKKVLSERAWDARTGLLLRVTEDADPRDVGNALGKFATYGGVQSIGPALLAANGDPHVVTAEATPYSVTTAYAYDLVGRVTWTRHPSGRVSRTAREVLADGRSVITDVPYVENSTNAGTARVVEVDGRARRTEEAAMHSAIEGAGSFYGLAPSGQNVIYAGPSSFAVFGHEGAMEARGTISTDNACAARKWP